MSTEYGTPLRGRGLRTAEGWIRLGGVEGSYHDGIEDELEALFRDEDELRSSSTALGTRATGRAQAFQLDADRANIVRGLEIAPDAVVLEIGAGLGAVTRYLGERAAVVDAVEPAVARARAARARTRDLPGVEVFVAEHGDVPPEPTYDLVVVVGVLEYVGGGSADPAPYVAFLEHLRRCLRPGGTIALAIENKLGVKYLVGAPEDHSDLVFDGIEGYPGGGGARTFSRRELEALFVAAGLTPRTLAAFPDYKLTRAVMDTRLLEDRAPELLRNLPAFPSTDLRSPRPRLADEQRVWGSLVDAGLASETGNSFLVLAGAGDAQQVWPDDLAAVYFSRDRRETYAFRKRVVLDGDGLRVERRRSGVADPAARFAFEEADEPFVPGPTLLERAAELPPGEIAELLRRWRALVDAAVASGGPVPLDLVPNNIVLRDADLVPVDQEWFADGWPADRLVRRGLLWFAAMLVRVTPPSRWTGFATVRDVARSLGPAAGLDAEGGWISLAVGEEAEFFAEIGRPSVDVAQGDVAADVAARRSALESMVDDLLVELPHGERLPELFERVRGYLAGAEESNAQLRSALEAAIIDRRTVEESVSAVEAAREAAAAAQLAAEDSARKARSAEAHQALSAERTQVAETRYVEQVERAQRAEAALAGVRGSRSYKVIARYYRAVDRLAPAGSRRRRVYAGGLRRVVAVLRALLRRRSRTAVAPLRVPSADQPLVSVVVPVHGKWEYTRRCLESLAATRGEVPFEVVVVDDASPDDSLQHLRAVEGLRVVAHATNTGYVGACNSGIAASRGDLVVLLNNDTRVDPDWLAPLVRVMDDPSVGLVGSRLVYPDGRLQEAGGIIFSDGSGWNYGKLCEPEDPAFTYRRDVDYVSGASIMVRRSVLEQLGGLDQRFAPAYYDDADLAFGVRSIGLRTVYEPTSVVVHDEGISHGTDETSGIKAYQVVNKAKFEEKWAAELALQLPPDAAVVQRAARRRTGPEGIVVVIDHYVPRADEDAGSVRMLTLLRALREQGHAVLFVPDNRHRSEPYTRTLQDLGVEVLYGHKNLGTVLLELRTDIRAVIASRVTVATGYLVQLRALLPEVPLVFDTVDLHFLREERAAALQGLDEVPPMASALRALELAMVQAADTTLVVSTFEQQLLQDIDPTADVRVLPTVHERREHAGVTGPSGREGLLFVGSFAHPPNADGLRWFTSEVLPLVQERRPGVRVDVIGRDPLPELVESAPAGVTYHGWVEDLDPFYARARAVIAPLRFGAGVKGKIGEAMTHGVPVVMTPVGAEGMGIADGETALVAGDAHGFADAVVRLLEDDELWAALSGAAREHVDARFGYGRFVELLSAVVAGRVPEQAGSR